MIFTERKITVNNEKSTIDKPVIVYRGDYEVELRFTIVDTEFKYINGNDNKSTEKASHAQLAVLGPDGTNMFSEITPCMEGHVAFVLTKEMIDELSEVGLYSFQIRLFDYYRESRVSIPPVEFGIEVREPVASEDHANTVDEAIVGYSIAKVVDGLNEDVPDTFDNNGDYNKTEWKTGDRISQGKLNKIEDAIDQINENEKADITALDKKVNSNFNILNSTKADTDTIWSMKNMGQDIKEAMTGGSVAVVGKDTILSENIVAGQVKNINLANNEINNAKLTHNFSYAGQLSAEDNLDNITRAGCYICIGKPINSPEKFATYSYYLEVSNMSTFVLQIATLYNKPGTRYIRAIQNNGTVYGWEPICTLEPLAVKTGHLEDNAIIPQKLHKQFNYQGLLNETHDLNDIDRAGVYLCLGTKANMPPGKEGATCFLSVENYSTWTLQTVTLFGMPHIKYVRKMNDVGNNISDWSLVNSLNLGDAPHNCDLNTLLTEGHYVTSGDHINGPSDITGQAVQIDVFVYASNFRWVRQECCLYNVPGIKYVRFIDKQGVMAATQWEKYMTVEQENKIERVVDGGNLNDIFEPGTYVFVNSPVNNPMPNTTSGLLSVERFNGGWRKQTVTAIGSMEKMFVRIVQKKSDGSFIFNPWSQYDADNRALVITGGDLNNVIEKGSYIFTTSPTNNPLSSSSGSLEVEVYNNRWVIQRAMHLKNQNEIYMRVIDTNTNSYYVSAWQSLVPPSYMSKLAGKTIVNFGDSIFGNTRGATSVSGQIAAATGATVHNCGFGGCRMSKHTGYWNAFSMYSIVDAIISKDFTAMETGANASDTSCPSYFKQTVELLKTIDFNKVDYITIAYGTNDYTAGKNLDVGKGDKNIDAYAGALRYSIEKLLTNFPHIKLLICTPIWRWWENENGISSDTKYYNAEKDTLIDFKNKVIEVCEEYHVPYLNGYDNVGINEFTKRYYFTSPDGTHPNANGNKRYAETIIGRLEQM